MEGFPVSRVKVAGAFLLVADTGEDVVSAESLCLVFKILKFCKGRLPLVLVTLGRFDVGEGPMEFRHPGVYMARFSL